MSFEEIITEIQNKPELWLSSHSMYKNKIIKARVWRELSIKLRLYEDTLKKRWKHLKDQYRKEVKKQPVFKSGSDPSSWESTWQYFSLMSFIKDEIMPPSSSGNLDNNEIESTLENENVDTQSDTEMIDSAPFLCQPLLSPVGSSVSEQSSSSRKRKNMKDHMLEIEKKKLLLMETHLQDSKHDEKLKNDEDYLFLKSILPFMKKLSELQKLRFRGKINDWLLEVFTENEKILI